MVCGFSGKSLISPSVSKIVNNIHTMKFRFGTNESVSLIKRLRLYRYVYLAGENNRSPCKVKDYKDYKLYRYQIYFRKMTEKEGKSGRPQVHCQGHC